MNIGLNIWEDALANVARQNSERFRKYLKRVQNAERSKEESEIMAQVLGAISDLYRNYEDMKKDNTKNADDYFHCKANFEATQRGHYGKYTAEILGDMKERVDYFKNRMFRDLSPFDAYVDYLHDKDVNKHGRQQAKNGLYNDSKKGCQYQRV